MASSVVIGVNPLIKKGKNVPVHLETMASCFSLLQLVSMVG
jgi:hypothetical protein